jgi:hypothetical protein
MPGYTVFLSGIYWLLPHSGDVAANIRGAQVPIIIIQLVLAIAVAVLISYSGLRLGGRTLGWVSGGMAVGYIPFGFNATVSLTETLALLLMSGVVLCVVELFRKPTREHVSHDVAWMIAYGLLGGLSILVRPTIALWLVVPLVTWVFVRRREALKALRLAGLGALCLVLVVSPWIARNAVTLHAFIPLTASASTPLLDSVGGATFTPAEESLMAGAEAAGKDPIRAVALERLATQWMVSPSGFIIWKATVLWTGMTNVTNLPLDILTDLQVSGGDLPGTSVGAGFLPITSVAFYEAVFTVLKWYHMAILGFAFAGLVLFWRRAVIWVLASVPVYYALVHTAILFMVRYFYPAMPALILLAAVGVIGAARLIGSRIGSATASASGA